MAVETIPKKILDFYRGDTGTLVIKRNNAAGTKVTIYTVPTGKVFYLVSGYLSWVNQVAQDGDAFILADSKTILFLSAELNGSREYAVTFSYPIPLKMAAGELVEVESNVGNLQADGGIVGYEVDA